MKPKSLQTDSTTNLLPKDGGLFLKKNFVPQSASVFAEILESTSWKEQEIFLFGKKRMQPRLISWQGEPGLTYKYSGVRFEFDPWSSVLLDLKKLCETETSVCFNSALLNLYRNGKDSMGYHADDEKELGSHPTIASLSFGETRKFYFQHKMQKTLKQKLELSCGDLLIMNGKTQNYWKHSIPKEPKVLKPRINITFRKIF